jgi:hypothetical protein
MSKGKKVEETKGKMSKIKTSNAYNVERNASKNKNVEW